MLEKIAKSYVAKISAVALSLSLALPAYANDYPVSQGSPSKLQKQWVAQTPITKETPLYGPFSEKVERYIITDQNTKGTIEVTVVKNTYTDTKQDYKILQIQEQILYRPKSKASGYILSSLTISGTVTAVVGLIGVAIEQDRVTVTGSYMCDGDDIDLSMDDTCTSYSVGDPIPFVIVFGAGGVLAGGSGYLLHKTKPFGMIATEESRNVVLGDKQEVRTIDSRLMDRHPGAVIGLQVTTPYFTVNGQYTADITTDETGHATVQLEPTNPNFAFSVDELANTGVAKQLNKAGIPKQKYLPLLEQAAVPISYDVVIETKATDGENATETVHVSGYEIPQKALEGIIMGL